MKTIFTLCLALATLAGSAQIVPIVRNKFTTNNSTASVVINADILNGTINSNKLDTATRALFPTGDLTNKTLYGDTAVSATTWSVTGDGNATFSVTDAGALLSLAGEGINTWDDVTNFFAWPSAGSVDITNTTGLPGVLVGGGSSFGIGTNLSSLATAAGLVDATNNLDGLKITVGTVADARIASSITRDTEFAAALTNNETRVVRFTSLVAAPTNYTDRVEATNSSTLTLYGGNVEVALESGAFKVRSPYYYEGIATGLTQIPGSGITAGSISNAAIAAATIESNRLAFAVATPTQVSDATNATSIRAITAQQTNQAAILALTAQQTNYATLINMLGPLTNGLGGGSGSATNLTPWTENIDADEFQLTDVSTVQGIATGATDGSLILSSDPTSDSTISMYGPTLGFGMRYSASSHTFIGPVNITNVSGALDVAGNVTATGTSNYVAALHSDSLTISELNVATMNATNALLVGKSNSIVGLTAGGAFTNVNLSGLTYTDNTLTATGGGTYSNLTETGYVSGFRSNVVVTGNALGTTITPLLTLTNATAAVSGTQQYSPALMLGGQGYSTTGSTSAPVSMGFVLVPSQGATPTASLRIVKSVGGAAVAATSAFFDDNGYLYTPIVSASSYIQAAYYVKFTSKSVIGSSVDGYINLEKNASGNGIELLTFGGGTTTAFNWQTTNWPALRVESSTNNVTLGFRKGTNTSEWLNFKGIYTPPIKAGFSTNYTMTGETEAMLFCTGTNQVITLPNATNSPGIMLSIRVASTTGSVIVTNATGAQTIFGTLSVSVGATNVLNVASDGSNWW